MVDFEDSWEIPNLELDKRVDLRSERVFTIDPESAKDLDDAVSCSSLADGRLKIGVHIADVSYFVKPNTCLDKHAQTRATTTYLVQKSIPMLPRVLSEKLCSLNPLEDRLCFSIFWIFNKNGDILDTSFAKTVINSCTKLSYQEAQHIIEGIPLEKKGVCRESMTLIAEDIKILYEISKLLRKRRFENGALSINQPKLLFCVDPKTSFPVSCEIYQMKESHRLIEEFMLLANISVAKKISDFFPFALLRCHPKPTKKGLENFENYTKRLGYSLNLETSKTFQKSISQIQDKTAKTIFEILAIKPMQRAKYICASEKSEWTHYALSVPLYTHFTSPIRRYADIVVHRMLEASITDDQTPFMSKTDVNLIAKNANIKKENARYYYCCNYSAAQDASLKLYLCLYLSIKQAEQSKNGLSQNFNIVDGIVIDIGNENVDIYVPIYAFDQRVFLAVEKKSNLGLWSVFCQSTTTR